MSSDTEMEQYAVSLNALGIQRNLDPFPFDPPKEVDYWADNKNMLQKIVQAQIDSMMFASSFIYILYGPVGGGKTFAVKYLANPKTQKRIMASLERPTFESLNMRVVAVAPMRAGQLTFSLYRNIVENCFSAIIKDQDLLTILKKTTDIGTGKIKAAFQDIRKMTIRSLEGRLEARNIEQSEGYKFLTQDRSRLGKIQDVNELVEVIRVLVKIASEKYERVIISLDELENLRRATGTERVLCSDLLRKMHETIEYNMTLFLIFTFETFEEIEQVLQPALLSRVKDTIEFPFVKDKSEVKEYITECISMRSKVNPDDVIEPEVIDLIASSLVVNFKGRLTFRAINREMHRIFTSTYIFAKRPPKYEITADLYKKTMKSVRAEDIVKQITEWVNK